MEITKIKIGDKVKNLGKLEDCGVPLGCIGIVLENGPVPFVKWEYGYGDKVWAQTNDLLELICEVE